MKIACVVDVEPDSHNTATYWLQVADVGERAAYAFAPGQINMLYLWGLGARHPGTTASVIPSEGMPLWSSRRDGDERLDQSTGCRASR